MSTSTERNALMVEMREGGATLRQVGDAFGISGERVRQLIGNASRRCAHCSTPVVRSTVHCDACLACPTCGKRRKSPGPDPCRDCSPCRGCGGPVGRRRQTYCRSCAPKAHGRTYRASGHPGIYRHHFTATGVLSNQGWHVLINGHWRSFATLTEALASRPCCQACGAALNLRLPRCPSCAAPREQR